MAGTGSQRKIIGTFHKTGSVLWQTICQKASREGVFRHWNLTKGEEDADAEVVLSLHAHRTKSILEGAGRPVTDEDRWLVCIRDPRDLLVSAAHYHCVTDEAWCHEADKAFGGLTYQEKINSFARLSDKLLFEMENSGGRAIANMTALRRELPDHVAHFVKLEDLLVDAHLEAFRRSFAFLGFASGRLVDLLAIAVECSFFSDPRAIERSKHARAAQAAEFLSVFDDTVTERFNTLFPDSLDVLGYPVEGMPPKSLPSASGSSEANGRDWPSRRPEVEYEANIATLEIAMEALSKRLKT